MIRKISSNSLLIITVFMFCCNNKPINNEKLAVILNDSAIVLYYSNTLANASNSIILLDSAIRISPKYYTAYWNLIAIQNGTGKKTDAFETVKKMSANFPFNPYVLSLEGVYYEMFNDSVNAFVNYHKADKIYESLIDTLAVNEKSYQSVVLNYALNLKLLHKEYEANKTLLELRQKVDDEMVKQVIDSFYINKKRKDLFKMYK
jgi:tetratricopeptide (TPR) repeat protein